MKKILVVLGASNSPEGELSRITKSRLDRCLGLYSRGTPVLCTGGWGSHFNIAPEAHAVYAQRYLLAKGVAGKDILEPVLSQNTVDDAVKLKEALSKFENVRLTVITSDYHMKRVKLIFREVLKDFTVDYVSAHIELEAGELSKRIDHEKKAIDSIMRNGLYY